MQRLLLAMLSLLAAGVFLGAKTSHAPPQREPPPHYFLRIFNLLPFGAPPSRIADDTHVLCENLPPGATSPYLPIPTPHDRWIVTTGDASVDVKIPQPENNAFFTLFLFSPSGNTATMILPDKPSPPSDPELPPPHRLRIAGFSPIPGLHLQIGTLKNWNPENKPFVETVHFSEHTKIPIAMSYSNRRKELVVLRRSLNFTGNQNITITLGADGPSRPAMRIFPDAVYPDDVSNEELIEVLESFSTP
jgi:hypothetical protein